MSQRPAGAWGLGVALEIVLERLLFCVDLTRPGDPEDSEGDFNGLLRIKVKLPGTKKSRKEVGAAV